MALFAIADLHLGFNVDKPMHVFGQHWLHHEKLLEENWRSTVGDADTVLIPGDISWAMRLHEVVADLRFIENLPGRKILLRGNHDYWWPSLSKLQGLCEDNQFFSLRFLKNNGLEVSPDYIICGTRGWLLPGDSEFRQDDQKIYKRELGRLELSLQAADKMRKQDQQMIVCLHFPPFLRDRQPGEMTALMEKFNVDLCVFGHIHGEQGAAVNRFLLGSVEYQLVAADALGFKPLRL